MRLEEKWRKNQSWLLYAVFSILIHFLVLNWLEGITFQIIEPDKEIVFNFEKPEETSQNKPKEIEVKEAKKKVIKPTPLKKPIPKKLYEIPDREIDPETKVSMYQDSFKSPKEDAKGKKQLFYSRKLGSPQRKGSQTPEKKPPPQKSSLLKVGKKNIVSLPEQPPKPQPESQGDFPVYYTPPSPPSRQPQKPLTGLLSRLDQYINPEDYPDEGLVMGDGISFSFDDASFGKYVWYGRIIKKKVKDGWFPPYVATVLGLTGKTVIKFYIMKDGKIRNLKIKESSGNPSLDNASLNAVKSAIPFSKLPDDYHHPQLGVVFSFWYNLRPSGT